jgi:hypothetical protein
MGAQLLKAFDLAKEAGGVKLQMRLAMKSGMSSDKAADVPDSPASVQKMEMILKDLTGKAIKL